MLRWASGGKKRGGARYATDCITHGVAENGNYPARTAALKVSKPIRSRNLPMRSPFLPFSLK